MQYALFIMFMLMRITLLSFESSQASLSALCELLTLFASDLVQAFIMRCDNNAATLLGNDMGFPHCARWNHNTIILI